MLVVVQFTTFARPGIHDTAHAIHRKFLQHIAATVIQYKLIEKFVTANVPNIY